MYAGEGRPWTKKRVDVGEGHKEPKKGKKVIDPRKGPLRPGPGTRHSGHKEVQETSSQCSGHTKGGCFSFY